MRLVLGSSSPRRRELLTQAGLEFEVVVSDIDETMYADESCMAYVERLARSKAEAVAQRVGPDVVVVGADSTVDVDGVSLGKPSGRREATQMMHLLSGRSHVAHTGVAVAHSGRVISTVVTTEVTFVDLDDATIEWYVNTVEPYDKAGGYGLQGLAGQFVSSIHGSASNVVGLPLAQTLALIHETLARAAVESGDELEKFR